MNKFLRTRENLVADFFNDWMAPSFVVKPLHGAPIPENFAVDIKENEECFIVEAEIPGLKARDIRVDVTGGRVTIGAEVKQCDQKTENENIVQSERYYGAVSRSFELGTDVNLDASKAVYSDGILTLTLRKKTTSVGKRLEVR